MYVLLVLGTDVDTLLFFHCVRTFMLVQWGLYAFLHLSKTCDQSNELSLRSYCVYNNKIVSTPSGGIWSCPESSEAQKD